MVTIKLNITDGAVESLTIESLTVSLVTPLTIQEVIPVLGKIQVVGKYVDFNSFARERDKDRPRSEGVIPWSVQSITRVMNKNPKTRWFLALLESETKQPVPIATVYEALSFTTGQLMGTLRSLFLSGYKRLIVLEGTRASRRYRIAGEFLPAVREALR